MPWTPETIDKALVHPDFQALPESERSAGVAQMLTDVHDSQQGEWSPQAHQAWNAYANEVRDKAGLNPSLLSKAGQTLAHIPEVIKGMAADSLTQSPMVAPSLAPALAQGFVAGVKDWLGAAKNYAERNRVTGNLQSWQKWSAWGELARQLETGDLPNLRDDKAASEWMAQHNAALDGRLADPENQRRLATYLKTRDPAALTALGNDVMRNDLQAEAARDKQAVRDTTQGRMLDAALGAGTSEHLISGSDPVNLAMEALPVMKGAQAARAVGLAAKAASLGAGVLENAALGAAQYGKDNPAGTAGGAAEAAATMAGVGTVLGGATAAGMRLLNGRGPTAEDSSVVGKPVSQVVAPPEVSNQTDVREVLDTSNSLPPRAGEGLVASSAPSAAYHYQPINNAVNSVHLGDINNAIIQSRIPSLNEIKSSNQGIVLVDRVEMRPKVDSQFLDEFLKRQTTAASQTLAPEASSRLSASVTESPKAQPGSPAMDGGARIGDSAVMSSAPDAGSTPATGASLGDGRSKMGDGEVDLFGNPIETPGVENILRGVQTEEVPLNNLRLSPDVPQFKAGADDKGIVEPLTGKYERMGTAPILVWERLNGQREVISGRHRFDLAKRTGENTIPAQVVREADGFSQKHALTADAEINIRDGQGQVRDYANYFRNAGIDAAEAEARGLLGRAKGRDGWVIGTQGSESLFDLHVNERLTDAQAVAIARAAPRDDAMQRVGIQAVLDGSPIDTAVNLMQAVRAEMGGAPSADQMDLFGRDDRAMQDMTKMAKAATAMQRALKEQVAAVRGAVKRPDVAKKMGVDVSDPKAVQERVDYIQAQLQRWENWPLHEDLRAQVRQTAGVAPKPAFGLESVTPEQLKAEQKAAADKRTIHERMNRPLQGDAGDIGTADMFDTTAGETPLFDQPQTQRGTRATGDLQPVLDSVSRRDTAADAPAAEVLGTGGEPSVGGNAARGGPGASSIEEWAPTRFGSRIVKAAPELKGAWAREFQNPQYRKQTFAEWHADARRFIKENGLEGAAALVLDPESGLDEPSRIVLANHVWNEADILQGEHEGTAKGEAAGQLAADMAEWMAVTGTRSGQATVAFAALAQHDPRLMLDAALRNRDEQIVQGMGDTLRGMTPAQVVELLQRELGDDWRKTLGVEREQTKQRVVKELNKQTKLTEVGTRLKMPKFVEQMLTSADAGKLTEREVLDAFAKVNGSKELTPDIQKRLTDLARKVREAPEGLPRIEATMDFQRELSLYSTIKARDALTSAWYANVLSALATQTMNVVGNVWNGGLRTMAAVMTSHPADSAAMVSGMIRYGLKRGLLEAKNAFIGGQTLKGLDKIAAPSALETLGKIPWNDQTAGQKAATVVSAGPVGRSVFRIITGADAFFHGSEMEGRAHLAASRALRESGVKPGSAEFGARVLEDLGLGQEKWQAALDQAATEAKALGKAGNETWINRRAWDIVDRGRDLGVRKEAMDWANLATYNHDPMGLTDRMANLLEVAQKMPGGRYMVPFVRMLANLMQANLNLTPIGILRGLKGEMLFSGRDGKRVKLEKWDARERIALGSMGTAAAGVVLAAALKNKDMNDVEVPFMPYASGPPSKAAKEMMPKGWKPYTIKAGDKYYSYAETPMGLALAMVGSYMDQVRYRKDFDEQDMTKRLTYIVSGTAKTLFTQGMLSSVANLMDVMQGEKDMRSVIGAATSGYVPASGLLRDIATAMDPTKIDANTIAAAMTKDLPVVRGMVNKPALNVWGEPVKIEGLPVVRRFVQGQRRDDLNDWLARRKLTVPMLPETIEWDSYRTEGEKRAAKLNRIELGALTDNERWKFAQSAGQKLKAMVLNWQRSVDDLERTGQVIPRELLQNRLDAMVQATRKVTIRELSEMRH